MCEPPHVSQQRRELAAKQLAVCMRANALSRGLQLYQQRSKPRLNKPLSRTIQISDNINYLDLCISYSVCKFFARARRAFKPVPREKEEKGRIEKREGGKKKKREEA